MPQPPKRLHWKLCREYLGLGRFFSSEDFSPWGLGVKEGQESPKIHGIQPTALPRAVVSLPKAHLPGPTESSPAAHPGQGLGAQGASPGSPLLMPLSPATVGRGTLGRKHCTHMGMGVRARAGSAGIKGASSFLSIQLSDQEGREKGRDPDGHAPARSEEPRLACRSQEHRELNKHQASGKGNWFSRKGWGEDKVCHLKDNHMVA